LEAEDREIQQAKLQELIRKGTPRDLAEANHLMKILSGYDEKNKTDYRAKAAEEVEQLKRKTDLFREILSGVSENETIGQGDVFEVGLA
jgi:ADP-ribosylation factor-binding protein GGA